MCQLLEVVDVLNPAPVLLHGVQSGLRQISPDLLIVELLQIDHLSPGLLAQFTIQGRLDLRQARASTNHPYLLIAVLKIVRTAGEEDFARQFGGTPQFTKVPLRDLPAHAIRHLVKGVEQQNDLAKAHQVHDV